MKVLLSYMNIRVKNIIFVVMAAKEFFEKAKKI
jgi:hypothetical protein